MQVFNLKVELGEMKVFVDLFVYIVFILEVWFGMTEYRFKHQTI